MGLTRGVLHCRTPEPRPYHLTATNHLDDHANLGQQGAQLDAEGDTPTMGTQRQQQLSTSNSSSVSTATNNKQTIKHSEGLQSGCLTRSRLDHQSSLQYQPPHIRGCSRRGLAHKGAAGTQGKERDCSQVKYTLQHALWVTCLSTWHSQRSNTTVMSKWP